MSYVIIISRDFSEKKKKERREEFVNVTSGRVSFLGPDALFGYIRWVNAAFQSYYRHARFLTRDKNLVGD